MNNPNNITGLVVLLLLTVAVYLTVQDGVLNKRVGDVEVPRMIAIMALTQLLVNVFMAVIVRQLRQLMGAML